MPLPTRLSRTFCPSCHLPLRRFSSTPLNLVFRPQVPYTYKTPLIDPYGSPIPESDVFEEESNEHRQRAEYLNLLAEPKTRTWYEKYAAWDGFGLKAKPRFVKVEGETRDIRPSYRADDFHTQREDGRGRGEGVVITQVGGGRDISSMNTGSGRLDSRIGGNVEQRLRISAPETEESDGFYNRRTASKNERKMKEWEAAEAEEAESWWNDDPSKEVVQLGEGFEWVKNADGSYKPGSGSETRIGERPDEEGFLERVRSSREYTRRGSEEERIRIAPPHFGLPLQGSEDIQQPAPSRDERGGESSTPAPTPRLPARTSSGFGLVRSSGSNSSSAAPRVGVAGGGFGSIEVPRGRGGFGVRNYGTVIHRRPIRWTPRATQGYSNEEPEVEASRQPFSLHVEAPEPIALRPMRKSHQSVFDTDNPASTGIEVKAPTPHIPLPPVSLPSTSGAPRKSSPFRSILSPGMPQMPTSAPNVLTIEARRNALSSQRQRSPYSPRSAEFDIDEEITPVTTSPPIATNVVQTPSSRETGWRPTKKLTYAAMSGMRELHKQDPVQFSREFLSAKFRTSHAGVSRILRSRWRENAPKDVIKVRAEDVNWEEEARPATRERAMAYVQKEEALTEAGTVESGGGIVGRDLRGTKWDVSAETGKGFSPVPILARAFLAKSMARKAVSQEP